MTALQQYIQGYFGVANESLEKVASLFHAETIVKGDFHTKIERHCDKLSFIKSGYFRIFAYADGKEITQWISTPGQFVTELSGIFFDQPSRWNIQALTDAEVYSISKKDYKNLRQHVASWDYLEKQFIAKCFITLENRVFSFLSMTAEERYHTFFNMEPALFNQVPLQYVASMLGMTPETLSRIRKKRSS